MRVHADVTVPLPFALDFCAKGPDVDPISGAINGFDFTVYFPPSMSEGTVGQSFFESGWAWWTGSSLRIIASKPIVESGFDLTAITDDFELNVNYLLSRILNSCRIRFNRPDIHLVKIDRQLLQLKIERTTGYLEDLPEPNESFFYNRIPAKAPLESSINSTTLTDLRADIVDADDPSTRTLLELDAEWAESLGDDSKANALRIWLSDLHMPNFT